VPPRVRPFGRTPVGVFAIVALISGSAFLGALSVGASWYVYSGTLTIDGGYATFSQYFTPGSGGYIHACSTYVTSKATLCGSTPYNYSNGPGTALTTGLYWGLFAAGLVMTVASIAAAMTITAGLGGKVRARRTRILCVTFVCLALGVAAGGAVTLAVLQPPAYQGFAGCAGFEGAHSPCNSLAGTTPCAGHNGSVCTEYDVSWHPDVGWYFAIGAAATSAAALVAMRIQPLGQRCPFCGVENRFNVRYCDTCSRPLPSVPERPPKDR
jgi:hypothetical protein